MVEQKSRNIIHTVQEYSKHLFRFIRGRVKTDEDAEDILQDVWWQFSNISAPESIKHVGAWLYKVAGNKIIDKYRKQSALYLEDFIIEDEDGEVSYQAILLSDMKTPEDERLKQLFWKELFAALDELPPEQRDVFIWNELEGMTYQDIIAKTGENINTLISRKRYAVAHLRKRLKVLFNELLTP